MRRPLAPIAISILLLVATAVVGAYVIAPTFRAIVATRNAIEAERDLLEQRYRQERSRQRAGRAFAEVERAVASLRERIPHERDALTVVRTIERIAAAHALEERLAIDWNAARSIGGSLLRVPTVIELRGPYPQIIAALREIERLQLPPIATDLSITSNDARGLPGIASPSQPQLVLRGDTLWRTGAP